MTKERIEKLLKAGANVILTTKGIDDMALKVYFFDIFLRARGFSYNLTFRLSKKVFDVIFLYYIIIYIC